MDPLIAILFAMWCGTPNLPMSSTKTNEKIKECRHELLDCYYVNHAPLFMCLQKDK